jgi:hypothetical protein
VLPPVPTRRLFRRSGLLLLLGVLFSITAAVAASLTLFTAVYDGANVRVNWEVSSETDVTGFDLYRKAASASSFSLVSNVVPTGQRRYQYIDLDAYRPTGGTMPANPSAISGPFTYRLTMRSSHGDQTYTTVLAGTPSAVQRSWGTIKSMFR